MTIDASDEAELVHESTYVLSYLCEQTERPMASLLLPRTKILYQDGDLFPSMDMNLPEGYLFQRLVELHPKMPLTKMHLLALMGRNGIGRVGFNLEGREAARAQIISKETILRSSNKEAMFSELVRSYLSTAHVCRGAVDPRAVVATIAHAMRAVLDRAATDARIAADFLDAMRQQWTLGLAYADEARGNKNNQKTSRRSKARDPSDGRDP